jgi:hypothetical protein
VRVEVLNGVCSGTRSRPNRKPVIFMAVVSKKGMNRERRST